MKRLNGVTTKKFKERLSEIEQIGIKEKIKEVFEAQLDFNPIPLCYFTDIGNPNGVGNHRGLTYQDNETPIETDVTLSSFAVTEDGDIIAFCFDKEGEYVFFQVE